MMPLVPQEPPGAETRDRLIFLSQPEKNDGEVKRRDKAFFRNLFELIQDFQRLDSSTR